MRMTLKKLKLSHWVPICMLEEHSVTGSGKIQLYLLYHKMCLILIQTGPPSLRETGHTQAHQVWERLVTYRPTKSERDWSHTGPPSLRETGHTHRPTKSERDWSHTQAHQVWERLVTHTGPPSLRETGHKQAYQVWERLVTNRPTKSERDWSHCLCKLCSHALFIHSFYKKTQSSSKID